MSVSASSTVSISPASTSARSSSSVIGARSSSGHDREGIGCEPYRARLAFGAMDELSDILRRLEPSLGPLSGEPVAARRRDHQPQLPRDARRARLRRAAARQGHRLLGIDREAERLANEAAARLGIAPEVAAAPTRTASSRASSSAAPVDAERAARRRRGGRARAAQRSTTRGVRAARAASGCPTCSRTTPRSSASAAGRCRAPTTARGRWRARIAAALPLAEPGPVPQRPARRATSCRVAGDGG